MKLQRVFAPLVAATLSTGGAAIAAVMIPASASAQSNNPVMSNVIPQSAAVTLHAKIQAINPET